MTSLAIDLDAVLGDTGPLWEAWLEDVSRRAHVSSMRLDEELPNWRALLERFAEDRAPVYVRPNGQVAAALRLLQTEQVQLGAFTEAPEELARVVLAHTGAARRIDVLECGPGSLERLLERLGPETRVVRELADLHS
jgi:phosphoglycolate phosphatase-like HAD superfamily hydrolase